MMNFLRKLISPPVFEGDAEKTRTARNLNSILWITGIILGLLPGFIRLTQETGTKISSAEIVLYALTALFPILIMLNKYGWTQFASVGFILLIWTGIFINALMGSGIYSTAPTAMIIASIMAGLLIGYRFSIFITAVSIGAVWFLVSRHALGAIPIEPETPYNLARNLTIIYTLIGLTIYLTISGLREALNESTANTTKLQSSLHELNALRLKLEQNVSERTDALTRRTEQLEAIGFISRRTAEIVDTQSLLHESARLIAERFNYYHAGIFLVDENQQYLQLKAASSEGGKRMLDRMHRMAIGKQGIVGQAAATKQAKIALDTGNDPFFSPTAELPLTRSEMALPLTVRDQAIGVLDIQSSEASAFSSADIRTFQTMADQIAMAIENARLLEQTQKTLAESQAIYQQYIRQEWDKFGTAAKLIGYRYADNTVEKLQEAVDLPEISAASTGGQLITTKTRNDGKTTSAMAIPIKVRGEVVGVVDVRSSQTAREWNTDEVTIAQALADRVSLAMENARLFEDASRRAERERQVGEITDKLGASFQVEAILRTAAEEISRAIEGTEVLVQIQPVPAKDQA
jgi:GAF domain-containing protein